MKANAGASWVRALLVFVSYYLYFVYADLSEVLQNYQSLLSPDLSAYWIWLVVYTSQFAFVCYQLGNHAARTNPLVNTRVVWPYLLHQVAFAAWLKLYEMEWLMWASIAFTCVWVMTLVCYLLITYEFRNGDYEGYRFGCWLMIEVPFALSLGWETFTLLTQWNSAVVAISRETAVVTPALELAAFIISIAIIVQAAVLFAGLPILMNPFLHVGLIWGCGGVAYRFRLEGASLFTRANSDQHDAMIPRAAGLAAAFTAALSAMYMTVSLCIMWQSKFCLPAPVEDEAIDILERGAGMRPQIICHTSPPISSPQHHKSLSQNSQSALPRSIPPRCNSRTRLASSSERKIVS